MKYLTAVVLSLILLLPAWAGSPSPEARARATLALAHAQKAVRPLDCACGPDCPCTAGECGSPNCPSLKAAPGPIEWIIYQTKYNQAVRQNKPLLIWVGVACPPCEQQWAEWIHAHLSEYDGPPYESSPYRGPGVIVARPDGMGGMTRTGTLSGVPLQSEVQALLGLRKAAPLTFAPPVMPMMPMMGGFGGGMMMGGGGCGGGG